MVHLLLFLAWSDLGQGTPCRIMSLDLTLFGYTTFVGTNGDLNMLYGSEVLIQSRETETGNWTDDIETVIIVNV